MKNQKSKINKQIISWKTSAVILVALVLVGVCIYLLFNKNTATSSTIPATTSDSKAATQVSPSKTSDKTISVSEKSTGSPATNESVKLTSPPTGTFVSNHHPSLGGNTKPSSEQSTCNTTPGATCYIKFTLGDIVKTLPSQIANSNGDVIWNWDIAKAGFTQGSWKITAVAQANDTVITATDSMNLEVQP